MHILAHLVELCYCCKWHPVLNFWSHTPGPHLARKEQRLPLLNLKPANYMPTCNLRKICIYIYKYIYIYFFIFLSKAVLQKCRVRSCMCQQAWIKLVHICAQGICTPGCNWKVGARPSSPLSEQTCVRNLSRIVSDLQPQAAVRAETEFQPVWSCKGTN